MSSIDHVHEQETSDAPAQQIAVDGSVGSDTDTGGPLKSEAEAAGKDESDTQHHARSNSVKKPTTFKAVSVTKNFLAKAGTPTTPAAKSNGDTSLNTAIAANTMPPAPRPRLVAKTASGNKASTPKSSHFGSRQGGSGPDPMQVWNRNRAAPQPTPKHFTDEELKQQYGIHLATRLQADADGKESKWADIDDDEDDWAPETIEWNDGTKITLSQNDTAAMFAEEQARAMVEKERQEEENKAKLAAQQKPTTTVGPNATVLKPRSAVQPKSGGLVLKNPSDKPTLVAKPSAPTPTRSPWAPLPPVEKVPPVEINPPTQPSTSRLQDSDPYGNSPMQPPSAAMEIAADDFTRTRRDNQDGNLGQLYNAQSGQYEPAIAGRRGSVRKEQSFRPPSLLQRSAARDQHEPAEPSAAFQTNRSGIQQDAAPWARRGSSTVSGDSGPQGQRMSMNKGSDMPRIPHDLLQRRDSQQSQVLQSPSTPGAFPHRGSSPAQQLPRSATQSPALQHSQLAHDGRSATGPAYQSRNLASDDTQTPSNQRKDVVVQRQLMKEKRELAIRRKKEEEEREEAAKKERIRLKMEELGLPPLDERRELLKKDSEQKQIEKREPELVGGEKKDPERREISPSSAQISRTTQDASTSTAQSPPKPPAPDASGMPQQYGMMKLHGAISNSMPQPPSERLTVGKTRSQENNQKSSPPVLESKAEPAEPLPSPRVKGVSTSKHPDVPMYRAPDASNPNLLRDSRQQLWQNSSRDPSTYTGWNGQSMTREPSASSSVWGPSNARNLGNGTFDRSVQRPQSRQQEQFTSPALDPIGPPRHHQRQRETSDLHSHDMGPSPVVEDFQTIPSFPPSDAPTPSTNRPEQPGQLPNGNAHMAPQYGIGTPFSSQLNNIERPTRGPESQKSMLAAWGNFHATDAEKSHQATQEQAAKMADEFRRGIRQPEPELAIMNETWRQVKVDEQSGQRHVIGVSKGQNTHGRTLGPQVNGEIQNPPFQSPTSMHPFTAAGMGRGSRFFPTSVHPQYPTGQRFPAGYRRSSCPPPPEDGGPLHPAYIFDSLRPNVNLPFMKEKPKVRLPPANATPTQSPQLAEVRVIPLRAASQPLVNNPSWQDRFDGLLQGVKKHSPEKKFVHVADFSMTKVPLGSPPVQISAAVSLPPHIEDAVSRSLEVASKAIEDEEALFENREFGSLPAVQIPTQAPEIGWSAVQAPKRGQYKNSKLSKGVESASKETYIEKEIISNGGVLIFIKMLGMEIPKSVALSRPKSQQTGHGQSSPQPYQGRNPNKGFRPREGSGNHGNDPKSTQRVPPRNASLNASSAQPRRPTKNHNAWGQRAANAVH